MSKQPVLGSFVLIQDLLPLFPQTLTIELQDEKGNTIMTAFACELENTYMGKLFTHEIDVGSFNLILHITIDNEKKLNKAIQKIINKRV